MNFVQTILLGAIAGLTIYLGLPVGRIKGMSEKVRSFLAMISAGILPATSIHLPRWVTGSTSLKKP